ncbi:hypothetical protein RQP46_004923 [Phenoliferia psychrophenolica]
MGLGSWMIPSRGEEGSAVGPPSPDALVAGDGADGSVLANYLDAEEESVSSLSSSPSSSDFRARTASSSTQSSLGSDDERGLQREREGLPRSSFSTASLREALDAIGEGPPTPLHPSKSASLPTHAPVDSDRPAPPVHSLSEPPARQLLVDPAERTPVAGQFSFPPQPQDTLPKSAFVKDPEPEPTHPAPPMLIPVSTRPSFSHRKTHSGNLGLGALSPSSAGGIHKRTVSGAIRLVNHLHPSDSSSPISWTPTDIEGLEHAGMRVHDFREPDATPTAGSAFIFGAGSAADDAGSGAHTPTAPTPVLVTRASSISRRGSLSRASSGRRARSGSKSGTSPLLNKAPLLSVAVQPQKRTAVPIDAPTLLDKLERSENGTADRPLLVVDVRNLTAFLGDAGRIKASINVNFPSLLIKRFRKGNTANFSLNSFITTDAGKSLCRSITTTGTLDTVDIVVVDQKPPELASSSPAAVLISVLERRDEPGAVYYLSEPFTQLLGPSRWRAWIVSGEVDNELLASSPSDEPTGLASLHHFNTPPNLSTSTHTPSFSIETPSFSPTIPSSPPTPGTPGTPGGTRRPRPPKLRRIDTSDDLLASSRTGVARVPRARSVTPPLPAANPSSASTSTVRAKGSRGDLRIDAHAAARLPLPSTMSIQALCHVQSKSPSHTATRFREADLSPPPTARPLLAGGYQSDSSPDTPSQGGGESPPWDVSTIIPGFLYLGPEPTKKEDLDDLERRGVKQVLNLALECDDRDGEIARRFDRYWKIGMRDFVEETGVQRSIEEACRILADAQLQSKPIYCHCRAGKSRSVTIVLAYLVHRNNWSLKRAYAHVSEHRKSISPNIGFVAELMKWEERERGSKSHGVFGSAAPTPAALSAAPTTTTYFPTGAAGEDPDESGRIRGARIRDSLPPGEAGAQGEREMEVRGSDGTWAPARRDPRDQNQNPMRRCVFSFFVSIGDCCWF